MKPQLTVAMPAYNVQEIVWLTLEGLARQSSAPPWELLIAEETSCTTESVVAEYAEALRRAGCVSIDYLPLREWTPLGVKWPLMFQRAAPSSKYVLLQGADDYTAPTRLEETLAVGNGAGWLHRARGLFYGVRSGRMGLYDLRMKGRSRSRTGVDMAIRADLARTIKPDPGVRVGADGWLFRQAAEHAGQIEVREIGSDGWLSGVYTDGANTLSRYRESMIALGAMPFSPWAGKLEDSLPEDVAERLRSMLPIRDAWPPATIAGLGSIPDDFGAVLSARAGTVCSVDCHGPRKFPTAGAVFERYAPVAEITWIAEHWEDGRRGYRFAINPRTNGGGAPC